MDRAPVIERGHGLSHIRNCVSQVRTWDLWSLPVRLRVYILAVVCADVVAIAVAAAMFRFRPAELAIFAALLACGAATVELTRRAGEPTGVVKDVYAVWELPVVILLPPLYCLVVPAIRVALTQWRVRKAPPHRRVFTAAAISLAYGAAWLVFRAILPMGYQMRFYLWTHTALWLLAAGACAVTQWAVNQALVLTAVKTADPATRIRASIFGRESLHNDVTELCAAVLVALGLTISWLALIFALPLATLLERSNRHEQLVIQSRADAKTGLLNAATWEREATAEVARAVRTRSPLAVALLDLDRFKNINDTYGHLLGDEVLRNIAITMNRVLRDYDLAGRFGGEEFVMLLPQTRAVDAFRIAERVRSHISQLPVHAEGSRERVPVTVSIGVAALDAGSSRELSELMGAADAALYRAKASGRDQVQMISTSRGLSAVRPPARDDDADAAGDALGDAFTAGNAAQPSDAGNSSTATTSAAAV
jgi:diguanylate cyclase (GGDEF)-like protein